ncbi:dienelactone hydrolase family protein [Hylemonella sp. W303a]|uniref:dienelactone hydrolase family protein n=1 Tax=Hylemonella sp. W303a TaxID=3389873 RepID=UPI00396AF318
MLNTDLDSEFKSLLSVPTDPSFLAGANRRTVIETALGVGYAASVLPIMAQTAITTSAAGLTAGEITITAQGGYKLPAYRAQPAGKTGLPVVLVLSEIFGVHEHIADVTRRFAHAGYLAIAPELFIRQGDAKGYTEIGKLMSEVISKVPDAQVMSDLDATLAWAGANGGDLKRVGVTGFCWGGRQVWLYSAHNPAIKAGVAWYGRLVGASSELTPKQPVDVAAQLNGPVLGLYGEADTGIPQESIAQMKQVLAGGNANAKASQFVVYKDAPHAFHADYRPSYRREAAEDGWKRALAWFKLNGVV